MNRVPVAAGFVLLVAAGPAAQAPPCGTMVTVDFTLEEDMTCAGTALIVGADGITVDLGGHSLTGSGAIGSAGVRNAGYDNVTIANGTITGFFIGVHLEGASSGTIRAITADGNVLSGIFLEEQSDSNRIESCVVINNGTTVHRGNGITINTSDGNTVIGTYAAGNYTQGIFIGGGAGTAASSNARILNNRSEQNISNGIGILGGSGHVATGNISMNNGAHGISLSSSATSGRVTESSVTANTVIGNVRFGIEIRKADRNRVAANRVEANGLSGIAVIDTSERNVVTGNRAAGNGDHGLFVAGGKNNSFRGNEFDQNGRRGILVAPDVMFGIPKNNTFDGNHAAQNGFKITIGPKFDVRDQTIGNGTAGTDSTYRGTRCELSSPVEICVP